MLLDWCWKPQHPCSLLKPYNGIPMKNLEWPFVLRAKPRYPNALIDLRKIRKMVRSAADNCRYTYTHPAKSHFPGSNTLVGHLHLETVQPSSSRYKQRKGLADILHTTKTYQKKRINHGSTSTLPYIYLFLRCSRANLIIFHLTLGLTAALWQPRKNWSYFTNRPTWISLTKSFPSFCRECSWALNGFPIVCKKNALPNSSSLRGFALLFQNSGQ